jgi:hypothetical protein
MTHTTRLATLLTALALAGCPGAGKEYVTDASPEPTTSSEPTTSPDPTTAQDGLTVTFDDLTYTHTYNVSPCDQLIGEITITNNTNLEATATATLSDLVGTYPVYFQPQITSVPAGGTATIQVWFNCSSTDDYTVGVSVTVTNVDETVTETATINGTVEGEP